MSVITDCPYICAPNIMDTPDYTTKMVTLNMVGDTVIKAGTPISADGKVANDETAIGILLNDCHACLGNRRGLVVISGRIKQDVAAEHSGIAISDEAKSALVNVTFTGDTARAGGAKTWADLGESNSFEINWDGTTEGREVLPYQPSGFSGALLFYKVSDENLTAEQLTGAVMTVSGAANISLPETYTITAEAVASENGYAVVTPQVFPLVISAQNGTKLGCSQGVYVLLAEAEALSEMFSATIEDNIFATKIKKTDIHTVPAEYLPEIPAEKLPEIGNKIVNVTGNIKDTTVDPSNNYFTESFEEVLTAAESGSLRIKDASANTYVPAKIHVFGGNLFVYLVVTVGSDVYLAEYCCREGTQFFSINAKIQLAPQVDS